MKARPILSLAQMAANAAGTGGRLVCPKCGCADFRTYKTQQGHVATFRYKACRHCGHKLLTQQQPEQMIRDVETTGGDSEDDEIQGDIL